MLCTSQQNNKIAADKDFNGSFDWTRTPVAPFGNRAAAFIAPDNRNTYTPRAEEAYVVGMAPLHYRLLEMFIPITRGYWLTRTYCLFSS